MARHHVERVGADAAGRAEYGDAPQGVHAVFLAGSADKDSPVTHPAAASAAFVLVGADKSGRGAIYSATSRAASGIAAVSPSMRSRIPPCPGSSAPLSFTPACRFIHDSNRSPTMLSASNAGEHEHARASRLPTSAPDATADSTT